METRPILKMIVVFLFLWHAHVRYPISYLFIKRRKKRNEMMKDYRMQKVVCNLTPLFHEQQNLLALSKFRHFTTIHQLENACLCAIEIIIIIKRKEKETGLKGNKIEEKGR